MANGLHDAGYESATPEEQAAYDDYVESGEISIGSPGIGIGGVGTGGVTGDGTGGAAGESDTQTLQEYRAGFVPSTASELFNLGQDLVQTIQEATGITVPEIVASLPIARSVFNLPLHHKEKNRLENLLGEHSPAYNAAYREIARVAAELMERMPAAAASILAHRHVNDRIEDGSFNPVIEIRPEDTQIDSLLDRSGAVALSNATNVPRIDGSDRGFMDEQGRVVPADQVMRNLAEVAARGGTLGPNQRAIVQAMTPEERRAFGIFLGPDGTVRSLPEIFGAAFINLSAGQPLSANQQAAVGAMFNAIPSAAARRDAITQLSLATGVDRATVSQAVGPAMRSAVADKPATTMPPAVRREILDAVGRQRTFTTRAGKTVSARQVVDNALRNIETGRPLTANQQRVIEIWNNDVTNYFGTKLDPSRPRSPNLEDRRNQPPLTAMQVLINRLTRDPLSPMERETRLSRSARQAAQRILRQAAEPYGHTQPSVPMPLFQTATGQSRTAQQVLQNAIENQARGRPLTANQRQLLLALGPQPVARPITARQAEQTLAARTFKTATGQTRTTQQVLANARQNIAAGRPLTANQTVALRQQAKPKPRPAAQPTYTTKTGQARTTQQVLTNARQNLAAGRSLTANQTAALRQQATPKPRPTAQPVPRPAAKPTYTTKTGQTRTTKQVLANAAANKAAGRALTANQKAALKQQAKPAPKPTPKRPAATPKPAPKPTYTTKTGQTRTTKQVLANATQNRAAGRPLTANQKAAVRQQAAPRPAPTPAPKRASQPAPRPAPRPAPKRATTPPRPAPRPAPKPKPAPKPTYTTKSGQTRTTAQVLANARQNKAAGRPLTANQAKALAAKKKAKK